MGSLVKAEQAQSYSIERYWSSNRYHHKTFLRTLLARHFIVIGWVTTDSDSHFKEQAMYHAVVPQQPASNLTATM